MRVGRSEDRVFFRDVFLPRRIGRTGAIDRNRSILADHRYQTELFRRRAPATAVAERHPDVDAHLDAIAAKNLSRSAQCHRPLLQSFDGRETHAPFLRFDDEHDLADLGFPADFQETAQMPVKIIERRVVTQHEMGADWMSSSEM